MINLEPNEKIYILKRRHPIVLKIKILPLILIFLFLFSFILFFLFSKISWPQILVEQMPQLLDFKLNFLFVFLFSLTLPIIWSIIFLEIVKYYLTYWVITNKRIIEVKFVSFFNVQSSSFELDKIQDMTVKIKGILASFFHFGDLRIQTAAEKGEFVLDQVEDPELIKQMIFEVKFDFQKQKYEKSY